MRTRDVVLGFDVYTKTVKYVVDNKPFYSTAQLRAHLLSLGFTQQEAQQYIVSLFHDSLCTPLTMAVYLRNEFEPNAYLLAVPSDQGEPVCYESTYLSFKYIPRIFFDMHIAWETEHGAVLGSSGVLALNATPLDVEATAYRKYRPKDASWLDVYNKCQKREREPPFVAML